MYEYHYDVMQKHYGKKIELIQIQVNILKPTLFSYTN